MSPIGRLIAFVMSISVVIVNHGGGRILALVVLVVLATGSVIVWAGHQESSLKADVASGRGNVLQVVGAAVNSPAITHHVGSSGFGGYRFVSS